MAMTKRLNKQFSNEFISIEEMIPQNHFLRVIEEHFDWNFIYDEYNDIYICPNEKDLIPTGRIDKNGYMVYKSDPKDCINCPFKEKCTKSKQK